jgi:hypothetical protein
LALASERGGIGDRDEPVTKMAAIADAHSGDWAIAIAAQPHTMGNLSTISNSNTIFSSMANSSNQYVVCKGTSGMGNRILAACTALLYGEITGRRVAIDWRDESYSESGENAFPKFFDCPEAVPIDTLPNTDSIFPAVWIGNLEMSLGALQRRLKRNSYTEMSFDVAKADYSEDMIVFCSYTHKTPALRNLFKGKYAHLKNVETPAILRSTLDEKLQLVPEIKAGIDEFKANYFGDDTIGVHVRYTDIKVPLDKIIGKVQAVARRRDPVIFLATDSQEVVETFQAKFPRLVTTNKWFPPDGQRMHQNWDYCPNRYENGVEALTDLFLLSECRSLVFSSKSSFGYVSSLLSKAGSRHIFDVEVNDSLIQRLVRKSKRLMK